MKYHDPLKQILQNGRYYWDRDGTSRHVRAAFLKVLQCGTPALGGEVFASESGELTVYHTCKSRTCPRCGHWATKKWIPERLAALPPVPYKGITFTMPKVLWPVFRDNRSLADALPALAAGAINAFMTAKHGLRPGVIAILHTFTGQLEFNSHVHTMVTAGGWRVSSGSWVNRVFYNRDVITRLWRRAVLDLLRTALRLGVLTTALTDDEMVTMLAEQERWWSVKIQSIDSVEHFFQYGGRYVRRPPIAQYRISYIGKRVVQFWAKDKKSGKIDKIPCSLQGFIDRLAQHILKYYQHAVRYFGLFAPRAVCQMFDVIFAVLGRNRRPRPAPLRWADCRKHLSGLDPLLDRTGQQMHWIGRFAPQS